ncbi:MAG: NAD-dependent epimerase [Planctomycetia bacterium]|nr:NAD-dependent epimerase [Planctomycetia bacterium]
MILVTGAAGFIGFHVASALTARGIPVVGIDNMNAYYDVSLKQSRLETLQQSESGPLFHFEKTDVADRLVMQSLFQRYSFSHVIHLAAQAGVRHSLLDPYSYLDSNLAGFVNILEGCRQEGVGHLIYASSSSVYGGNRKVPYSEHDAVDHPLSLYAATKRANELLAHSYSHLYDLPTTGLRFFTVYGPWGRPDMAIFKFVKTILENGTIDVFNGGDMKRDFTYIDDIVDGVLGVLDNPPRRDENPSDAIQLPDSACAPFRIYNLGNSSPVQLAHLIDIIETTLGKVAKKRMLPMQPGDMYITYADMTNLPTDIGFKHKVPLEEGVRRFVDWYRSYYNPGNDLS